MRYAIFIFTIFFQGVLFSQETPVPVRSESVIQEVESTSNKDDSDYKSKKIRTKKPQYRRDKAGSSSAEQTVQYQKFSLNQSYAKTQRSQRSPNSIQQSNMDQVVSSLEQNAPNSFEYHYFKYVAGNYNVSLASHLRKAEEIRPDNADVLQQLVAYYVLTSNLSKANVYLERLVSSGKLSKSVLNYAWDILLSTPKNGTLMTHGFDDTYGVIYMQSIKNIRPDVRVISLDLLQSETLRASLKKEGYDIPNRKTIDTEFLADFCSRNASKRIVISTTTPKEYLRPMSSKLYLTGLVMEYSNSMKENFSRNEILWNSELKKHLVKNASTEKDKQLSSNYLPMLLILRKEYNSRGYVGKVKELDKSIDAISVQCRKYEKVQKLKGSY